MANSGLLILNMAVNSCNARRFLCVNSASQDDIYLLYALLAYITLLVGVLYIFMIHV
jgi:hypothetical protein